jgi:AAHS family 4-hydroxybenzoate transporter-like MFS transporter
LGQRNTIDVSEIIEQQKLSGFLAGLVAISWIITFLDGFDSNLISFAAPYFASQYHLDRIQLGNIFSMGLLGTLIGGFILGYVGDRIGRRPTVILAAAGFGVLTMCFALANSYGSLFALRLLNGIPLGGMLPLAWALNIEYAPKRYRATIVTVIMMGYSLGTALGGPIATWLIPKMGWKAVFVIGGVVSLLSALVLFLLLPESIRFLASKGRQPDRIAAVLRRIAPGRPVPAGANFVVADEAGQAKDFRPALLFRGELRWITPLIWTAYIFSSMAVFFIVNWTPLVFEALNFTRAEAAAASSMNSLMGAVGGLILMRFTDKRGAIAITTMPVVTAALLLITGLVYIGHDGFLVMSALIGGFLIGGHFGMHSICGIFYPSAYRGNGAGWATSVAKIGSVAGPILGGIILSTSLPVRNIYAVLAVCPAVFAVCIYAVGRMHRRILGREALAVVSEDTALAGRGDATNFG